MNTFLHNLSELSMGGKKMGKMKLWKKKNKEWWNENGILEKQAERKRRLI